MTDFGTPIGNEHEWVVDVVLRAHGHGGSEARVVEEVEQILARLPDRDRPRATSSYDLQPPDGSIGVSCWVTGKSAGEAVESALQAVNEAAFRITGERHLLWPVRLVPGPAVFARRDVQPAPPSRLSRRKGRRMAMLRQSVKRDTRRDSGSSA